MRNILFLVIVSAGLWACSSKSPAPVPGKGPRKAAQWINPLFFNEDFDNELAFPLWFDDSLIRANGISKITKRIYPRILGDTGDVNSQKEAMPREKREYYFDDNGLVDRLVIYFYFDDREIARASFMYKGNMDNNGFRQPVPGTFRYLSEEGQNSDFRTDLQSEREYSYVIHDHLVTKQKFTAYQDVETKDQLLFMKDRQYWGALSVDSIMHPAPEDWVIWGTPRKPYKRYKVENKVTETNVHLYKYWKSGVLKERITENYPFVNKRSYQYNDANQWVSYVDSTFSENIFITRIESIFQPDATGKPVQLMHRKENSDQGGFFYLETFRYHYKQ